MLGKRILGGDGPAGEGCDGSDPGQGGHFRVALEEDTRARY